MRIINQQIYNYNFNNNNFKGVRNQLAKDCLEVTGSQTKAKVFAKYVEPEAINEIKNLCNIPVFKNAPVRIMPDVSACKDCVVGFSAIVPKDKIKDVPPNIIGNDIGCGVLLVKTDAKLDNLNLKKIDNFIKSELFTNKNLRPEMSRGLKQNVVESCKLFDKDEKRILDQSGTLGNGNHFIEIDADDEQNIYLSIHTGSRQYGSYIKEYYENALKGEKDAPRDISYSDAVKMAQSYAKFNRKSIANMILNKFKLKSVMEYDCPHNYISDEGIVHKGSIDAEKGKPVLIPLNMRDGIILGKGKGNTDWNYSAPHGAGRKLSRFEARTNINVDDYKKSMKGIYSSVVGKRTLDEAPQAYKDSNDTIDIIKDTVDIETVIKPVYNYKKH